MTSKPRIVRTVRTPKQREQTEQYKRKDVYVSKSTAGLPQESWWIKLDRETFDQRVQQEAPRMAQSKFGSDATGKVRP